MQKEVFCSKYFKTYRKAILEDRGDVIRIGVSGVHEFVIDIVKSTISNVISKNLDISIPVPSVLFVPHPQSMDHFMNCNTNLRKKIQYKEKSTSRFI